MSRGLHRHGRPAGERTASRTGLDELQGLAPELVVVALPAVGAHNENAPPIIESEFLQSNDRSAVQFPTLFSLFFRQPHPDPSTANVTLFYHLRRR